MMSEDQVVICRYVEVVEIGKRGESKQRDIGVKPTSTNVILLYGGGEVLWGYDHCCV